MSVEKVAYCHFFEFFSCFASRIRSRAAKPARYENLEVFIRSDVHAVIAGIKLKGQAPLNNPRVFRHAVCSSGALVFLYILLFEQFRDLHRVGLRTLADMIAAAAND